MGQLVSTKTKVDVSKHNLYIEPRINIKENINKYVNNNCINNESSYLCFDYSGFVNFIKQYMEVCAKY
tara:strand:+ start:599 stop:802 length:204 start_codon:yes stop_codon:yes gene_type:complete